MNQERLPENVRNVFSMVMLMLFAAIFLIYNFISLYSISRENIVTSWRNTAMQTVREINDYMSMPIDAVSFSAVSLNEMMDMGAAPEEVQDYLIRQTEVYASAISSNSTGVYAYYDGRYLDGSGWVPPDAYDPTSRPWYQEAVEGKGEIVTVMPYTNLQTFEKMMSVCKLLEDGKSVVSMDIFLSGIQKIVDDTADNPIVEASLIIDRQKRIVAHSDLTAFSRWLNSITRKYDYTIMEKIQKLPPGETLTIWNEQGGHLILKERVSHDMDFVLMLYSDAMFSPLRSISRLFAISLLIVSVVILAVFIRMDIRRRESEQLYAEVNAVADIYDTVLKADLKKNILYCTINKTDSGNRLFADCGDGQFISWSRSACSRFSSERSEDLLRQFMDPDTLEERLEGINSLVHEFIDNSGCWNRLRYIVVDRDKDNRPHMLLIAFESIDEEKKQGEKLRRLSETDLMTGVYNRGAGEKMIRLAINEGKNGLFCMLDADAFKSVNDNYGHDVGDKVIKGIAASLTRAFRESDIVFRLGGDEFAVFAGGVKDRTTAETILKRLFGFIDTMDIPELGDRKISVSVGASFFPSDDGDTFESLYRRADEGTYDSKKYKGNYVTFR